jgi:hypothetical protein
VLRCRGSIDSDIKTIYRYATDPPLTKSNVSLYYIPHLIPTDCRSHLLRDCLLQTPPPEIKTLKNSPLYKTITKGDNPQFTVPDIAVLHLLQAIEPPETLFACSTRPGFPHPDDETSDRTEEPRHRPLSLISKPSQNIQRDNASPTTAPEYKVHPTTLMTTYTLPQTLSDWCLILNRDLADLRMTLRDLEGDWNQVVKAARAGNLNGILAGVNRGRRHRLERSKHHFTAHTDRSAQRRAGDGDTRKPP